jgi:hypothetical protein
MRLISIVVLFACASTLTNAQTCEWKDSKEFIKLKLTQNCLLSKTQIRDGNKFYLCCGEKGLQFLICKMLLIFEILFSIH